MALREDGEWDDTVAPDALSRVLCQPVLLPHMQRPQHYDSLIRHVASDLRTGLRYRPMVQGLGVDATAKLLACLNPPYGVDAAAEAFVYLGSAELPPGGVTTMSELMALLSAGATAALCFTARNGAPATMGHYEALWLEDGGRCAYFDSFFGLLGPTPPDAAIWKQRPIAPLLCSVRQLFLLRLPPRGDVAAWARLHETVRSRVSYWVRAVMVGCGLEQLYPEAVQPAAAAAAAAPAVAPTPPCGIIVPAPAL
jgi:hypothetical protein